MYTIALQERIPIADEHGVVAVWAVGVHGMMRDDDGEWREARCGEFLLKPRELCDAFFFRESEVDVRRAVGIGLDLVRHVAIERDEVDERLLRGEVKAVPLGWHGPACVRATRVSEFRFDLAGGIHLVVVVAENGVCGTGEDAGGIEVFKVRLPSWGVDATEQLVVPVVAEHEESLRVKALRLGVLHHACGDEFLCGRVRISPVADHQEIRFAMRLRSDDRHCLRGENGGTEADGLPQKAATSDLQIHLFRGFPSGHPYTSRGLRCRELMKKSTDVCFGGSVFYGTGGAECAYDLIQTFWEMDLAMNVLRSASVATCFVLTTLCSLPMRAQQATAPTFEVATIRPSDPMKRNHGFHVGGNRVNIENQDMITMISVAYSVHPKQIVNAPDWFSTDQWVIDGVADKEGKLSVPDVQGMLQKLLADRFGLKIKREQREMPVYALTVAKGGPKLTVSKADPNALPNQNGNGKGNMRFQNTTITTFLLGMQDNFDRPLVDQTGLDGHYDFTLRWTPDTPPAGDADAPPGMFTAIQEQLGLKVSPVKAPANVLVIESAEKPSAN